MRAMRGRRPGGGGARAAMRGALAAGLLLGAGGPARAATIDFESAPSGADTAAIVTQGVEITGGLVLDESLVEILLGYPATGTWNTTPGGTKGVLNTLSGVITLSFDVPVSLLQIDVLTLPDGAGDPGSVLLLADDGGLAVGAYLDPALAGTGDSGLPEGTLSIGGTAITSAILCPASLVSPGTCLDPAEPTTFWIDQIRFEPVPEPATALLFGLALGALAAQRRIS